MSSSASSTVGDANRSTAAPTHEALILSSKDRGWAREAIRASPSPGGATDAHRRAGRKRRRIPRACDDCRRKKIKCDGKRPCTSCADFNSQCTYNGPSVRGGGNAATGTASVARVASAASADKQPDAEVAALEKRLRAAESVIRRCLPQLDLDKLEDAASAAPQPILAQAPPKRPPAQSSRADEAAADGSRYFRLVGSADQLDLTDSGEYQFHGISSGAAFLSRIDQHFPGLLRPDSRMPFLPQPRRPAPAKPLELPVYSANPWRLESHDHSHLPPRDLARALCGYALSWGSCLLRVVHAPSFWTAFEMLYAGRPQSDTNQQRRFVGLLFAVMALGSMYDVDENDPTNPDHYAVAIERGYKYYTSARHFLQDITECSDMATLQAMVFLIQFLQATGNLNGCHTLIGIALRSALRMGLHRHLPHIPMSPIQDETRRRVFHTIRQMDIYLCTSLGLPILLRDGDINQPRPTEVDDEYITENGIQPPPPGTSSFLEAFNAHLELMRILADVVDHLYPPPRGADPGLANVTYVISCARVREMEQALHDWHEKLGETWRPGPEENAEITRVKIFLRSAYAHVQLMLYRPFLQYYSRRASADETADARYFAFAAAGISVCRNIIYIGLEIRRQGVLIGPYWFITNTQFFAILTLVLYVLYNPDKPEASELFADAKLGKECISGLTQRSLAADRVTTALNSFFDQLPGRFRWADPQISTRNPDAIPPVGPSHIEYQTNHDSRQPTLPLNTSSQGRGSLDMSEATRSGGCIAADQQELATQSNATVSRPAQYHEALSWMALPQEDPFAYPIMPGVSLTNNDFSTFEEDGLRLPLYDLHPDMDGQLLQLQDPLHASLLPYMSTDPSETLYAALAASANPSSTLAGDAQDTLDPPWNFQT